MVLVSLSLVHRKSLPPCQTLRCLGGFSLRRGSDESPGYEEQHYRSDRSEGELLYVAYTHARSESRKIASA